MKFLFFCLKVALFILAFVKAAKFCEEKTAKFRLERIFSSLGFEKRWETSPLSLDEEKRLDDIFNQKFTFLGSGGQCYAFVSENGASVIKFFKHHRRSLPTWIQALPLSGSLARKREKRLVTKKRKLERDFASYKLSFERLRKETGVLYVHLNKTDHLKKRLTIVDKINIAHAIDLDEVEFVVQKRAELVYPHIKRLVKQNNEQGAKQAIRSIIALIVRRCQKGVFDEDPRIHRNFGFIGNDALIIDVGRLVPDQTRKNPNVYSHDLRKITERFKIWLEDHHPQLVSTLDEELLKYTS